MFSNLEVCFQIQIQWGTSSRSPHQGCQFPSGWVMELYRAAINIDKKIVPYYLGKIAWKTTGQLIPWIHTTGSEPHRGMPLSYIPVIHMYLWSVPGRGRGTDQGVAQLQQEFPPDFETQILPLAIFRGYTVIKGVGWTQTGWDNLSHPSLPRTCSIIPLLVCVMVSTAMNHA